MISGCPECECGHVEPGPRVTGVAELKKGILVDAELSTIPGEIVAHEFMGKYIGSCGNRRMGGEDRSSFYLCKGIAEGHPSFHPLPDPLQLGERRMPFIEVQCRKLDSQIIEHFPSPDPEYYFLAQALFRLF